MDARGDRRALNFSGAAEADGNFSRFDDNRHLAAAFGKLQHAGESLVIFEHVEVLEGNFPAGIGLPGPGRVGS